jgi:hypothetical protein
LSGLLDRVVVPGLVAITLLGVGACGAGQHRSSAAVRSVAGASTPSPASSPAPTASPTPPPTPTPATPTVTSPGPVQSPSALASPIAATQIAATQIVSYSPYVNGSVRPGLQLTSTQTADTSASPVPVSACIRLASGAWDCQLGADVSPCYPAVDQRSCLFVESPWATTAERILVPVVPAPLASNAPIPANIAAITATHPWAVELTDGRLCHDQLQGAGDWIGTVPLSYSCTPAGGAGGTFCSGTADNCLYGYVDRMKPVWTIEEGDQPDCKPGQNCIAGSPDARISGTVAIARAWFK